MKSKLKFFLSAFLGIMLISSFLIGCSSESDSNAKKDYSNVEFNPDIAIPGFGSLDFKAGKKKQSVNFYNPDTNTCFFKISLVLKDESGDSSKDKVLWTSEYIEPGEKITSIRLTEGLNAGEYPGALKYECYSLFERSPLNGSNIELTVKVR